MLHTKFSPVLASSRLQSQLPLACAPRKYAASRPCIRGQHSSERVVFTAAQSVSQQPAERQQHPGQSNSALAVSQNASSTTLTHTSPSTITSVLQRTLRRYQHYILACGVAAAWCYFNAHFGVPQGAPGAPFAHATVAAARAPVSSDAMAVAVSSAWAGLAAGFLHTLAGADHLAALTPLTIGVSHLKAAFLGALWGFGHSTGQLMLGLAMVLLKDRFEMLVPALTRFGGTTVGIILVLIGLSGLIEGITGHGHDHDHGDGHHHHTHETDGSGVAALTAAKDKGNFQLATFATGVVYGLHPDALFVVIPALTLPTKLAAAGYILMFVLGTIIAMGSYTAVIGATSKAIEERNAWLAGKLSSVASILAICVGAAILLGEFGITLPFHLHVPGLGHFHSH